MVDDDVLGADRGEAVAAEVTDALGEAGRVRREQQIGTVIDDQLPQIGDAEDAVGMFTSMPRWIATPRRRRFSAVS